MKRFRNATFAALAAVTLGQSVRGQTAESGEKLFTDQIQPVFESRCLGCHRGETAQAGLDLSTRAGLLKGGERGPAVVLGDAKASLLYRAVNHEAEPHMPPGGRSTQLPAESIAVIAAWINAGVPFATSAPAGSKSPIDIFNNHVRPVLETRCVGCHGTNDLKRGGLDLTTRETMIRGGDNGAAIVAGKSADSLLIQHIQHKRTPGMPFQGEKLAAETIAYFAAWIDSGAPFSKEALRFTGEISATEKKANPHWAFVRPQLPAVPPVKSAAWVRNPIDAFVAAEHEARGLKPVPETDKRKLLRRIYVDLIGLPPTPEETKAFLDDLSADAYEKVVDRLLADPRYGERWGRHWMDIWRYSDWSGPGERTDYSYRHLWQWRDWIIESINADKGYDRMVVEMLAGDEIAPTDPSTLRATGYLARSWFRYNRHSWLQDTVDHTATAFLGVTLRCARCHEHKYDPIQQEEYYRFRAFFEPYDVRIDPVPGEVDLQKKGLTRVYEAETREALPDVDNPGVLLPAIFPATFRLIRGEESSPDDHELEPGVPAAFLGAQLRIQAVDLPTEASFPSVQPFVQEELVKAAERSIEKAEGTLNRAQRALAHAKQRVERSGSSSGTVAAGEPSTPSTVSFDKDIKPIFSSRCLACHNAQANRSGLSLENLESVLAGGVRSGPSILPRNSEGSPLILYLRGEKSPRMPMGGEALTAEQIQLVAKWIDELPEEDPQTSLRKAQDGAALAETELTAARACLPALHARIAADRAKFQPSDGVDEAALAEVARRTERQAHVLKAEASVLAAQQKLADALRDPAPVDEKTDGEREKKLAVANRELDAARKSLERSVKSHTHIGPIYPAKSSGRRTALARWIVNEENPLTARVAVNHMWLRHFGRGLVPTVDNFGLSGTAPTHPQLLDWLALTLIQENWSMKALHRLMVTSSTYRMKSATAENDPNRSIDPDNHFLWRMNPRRLEAEAVRDSLLYVSGRLDSTIGGPEEKDENSLRRGMYFKQSAYGQTEFLRVFDVANPAECYQRSESIMPQQALAMANSAVSLTSARELAAQIYERHPAAAGFINAAFEIILGRPPSTKEVARATSFLKDQAKLLSDTTGLTAFGASSKGQREASKDPAMRARENLVHVLFNHNDFVTIR